VAAARRGRRLGCRTRALSRGRRVGTGDPPRSPRPGCVAPQPG
jgi:hypothetical protein